MKKDIRFYLAKWHMERWCHFVSKVIGREITSGDVKEILSNERPKGEWIDFHGNHVELNEYGAPNGWAKCSICKKWLAGSGKINATKGYFCPNCGAEMNGEE